MHREPSMKGTTGELVRTMRSPRRESSRNSKLRRLALEGLEYRMLLSTLPTPTVVSGSQSFISYNGVRHGSQTSQTIAVDPQDPSKMVAAWVLNRPDSAPGPTVFVQAAASDDGGQTWSHVPFGGSGPESDPRRPRPSISRNRPTRASPSTTTITSTSSNRRSAGGNGALVLNSYDFSATSPTQLIAQQDESTAGSATMRRSSPTLTVDAGVSSFMDPDTDITTQTDPTAGDVYVAWTSNDTAVPERRRISTRTGS